MLALAGWLALGGMQAPPASAPDLALWRLDCGRVEIPDLDIYSDAYLYAGRSMELTASCYLIRHRDRYLLWDTGMRRAIMGQPERSPTMTFTLRRSIMDQLAEIGVDPGRIAFVGISHRHTDHIGQAADFPGATLLMGREDFEAVRQSATNGPLLAPWTTGGSRVMLVDRDHDLFGDGSVMVLDTPGHTQGHQSLLVRLPETGNILLTGDLFHFREQIANAGVPRFNADRADTLASIRRLLAIASSLDATIVIQHDPRDIARLPAFPAPAR